MGRNPYSSVGKLLCVRMCVCVCIIIHTSKFNCPRACQGVVHSMDIQVWRFD